MAVCRASTVTKRLTTRASAAREAVGCQRWLGADIAFELREQSFDMLRVVAFVP